MTAPGASAPQPGRTAYAGRPAGVLLTGLLVGLLALLPCAGRAHAVGAKPVLPATSMVMVQPVQSAHAVHHQQHTVPVNKGLPHTWCSVDGEQPVPGSGCSDHPFCGQESQLPNAPPQPAAVAPALLVSPVTRLGPALPAAPVGPDLAPDLHALQVHRT